MSLMLLKGVAGAAKASLPVPVYASLKNRHRQFWWGGLRRVQPVSRSFGFERGQPIDRYYIEGFLAENASDIRGRVLEIGDRTYTLQFGGEKVAHSDVLHVRGGADHPETTIVADLANASQDFKGLASDSFDCIICTQTLMFIYDVRAAIETLHRILKPGGTLLMTVAGISQICRADMDQWGDYWRFTTLSARKLLQEAFAPEQVRVESRGNVLAAVGFLHGLSVDELRPDELDHRDRDYELVVLMRAVKQNRAGAAVVVHS